jgi:hypothetical protein
MALDAVKRQVPVLFKHRKGKDSTGYCLSAAGIPHAAHP